MRAGKDRDNSCGPFDLVAQTATHLLHSDGVKEQEANSVRSMRPPDLLQSRRQPD